MSWDHGTCWRKGSANSARGAARLIADTLVTTKSLGADPRRGSRLALAAITFNLLRAAGCLAGTLLAKTTTATLHAPPHAA